MESQTEEQRAQSKVAKDLHEGHKIQKAVTIRAKPEGLYQFWRNLSQLKSILSNVNDIVLINGKRSRWEVQGPFGTPVTWTAEIIEDKPGHMISWKTLPGSDVNHSGSIWFLPRGEQTEIKLQLLYNPPGGKLGDWVATLRQRDPGTLILENLRRFKALIETGEVPTVENQPHGEKKLKYDILSVWQHEIHH